MNAEDFALTFEGVLSFERKNKDGIVVQFTIHPNDAPPDLLTAWIGTRYLLSIVEIGDDEQPVAPKSKSEGRLAVSSAGALCRNSEFRKWLSYEMTEVVESEEEAAEVLRKVLAIKSRRDLETDVEAREVFNDMKNRFISDHKAGKLR